MTTREREIAILLAAGLSQREIAARLCIAPGTCYRHTNNMRRRTQKSTAAIAVQAAAEMEWGAG